MVGSASTLLVAVSSLVLSHADSLFNDANRAYEEGRYADASALYETIRDAGLESPELYFNMGDAYFRQGRLGKTILSYRRCLRLSPRDGDARHNLLLVRRLVTEQPAQASVAERLTVAILETFSSRELTTALLTLYWVSCLVGLYHLFRGGRWTRALLLMLGACSVLLVLLWVGRFTREKKPLGVVTETADARSGPGQDYQLQFAAGEGTEVLIEKSERGWHLVRVPGGHRGWIETGSVERW